MSFTCSICNQTFEEAWTEEEAEAELENNFPGIKKEQCDVVCDDCWKNLGFH